MKGKRIQKRTLSVLTTLALWSTLFTFGGSVSADSIDPADKIDPVLLEKMENAGDTETFPVMLWLTDLEDTDAEQIEEQAQARTENRIEQYAAAQATMSAQAQQQAEELDETQIYIEEKRAVYAEKYAAENQEKFNDIFPATKWQLFRKVEQEQPAVIYTCVYAPAIKLQLNKAEILTAAQSAAVDMVYDDAVEFVNGVLPEDGETIQPMSASTQSSVSAWQGATYANQVRDVNNLTGSGVKIGQIEVAALKLNEPAFAYYQTPFLAQWQAGTITVDSMAENDKAELLEIKHAAQVASIMIGSETNGIEGIAPFASLYSTCFDRTDGSGYQGAYEWLLSQGVNIINMSATIGIYNSYSAVARWLDHIAINHDVTLVLAAGNDGANAVPASSMAYNAIAVGALDDKNTASRNDDSLATFSSYVNGSLVSKPDICAPGDNLQMAIPGSTYNERCGTSFAAPQVTAIIAQMLQMRPQIKTNQAVIKAIVLSGVNQWSGLTNTPVNTNTRAMTASTGAGEVDSKAMRYIAQAQRYVGTTLTSGVNTYTTTFNVSASDTLTRVALTWLRNNRMASGSHNTQAPSQPACAKLKLEVTAPGGGTYTSYVAKENCQLVSFAPTKTGTYTVKVTVMERPSTEPNIHIGLAFY